MWIAVRSAFEVWRVLRNRVTDGRGRPLWFYRKVEGMPLGAAGKKQALVLTIGMTVVGALLGLPLVFDVLIRLLSRTQ